MGLGKGVLRILLGVISRYYDSVNRMHNIVYLLVSSCLVSTTRINLMHEFPSQRNNLWMPMVVMILALYVMSNVFNTCLK